MGYNHNSPQGFTCIYGKAYSEEIVATKLYYIAGSALELKIAQIYFLNRNSSNV